MTDCMEKQNLADGAGDTNDKPCKLILQCVYPIRYSKQGLLGTLFIFLEFKNLAYSMMHNNMMNP